MSTGESSLGWTARSALVVRMAAARLAARLAGHGRLGRVGELRVNWSMPPAASVTRDHRRRGSRPGGGCRPRVTPVTGRVAAVTKSCRRSAAARSTRPGRPPARRSCRRPGTGPAPARRRRRWSRLAQSGHRPGDVPADDRARRLLAGRPDSAPAGSRPLPRRGGVGRGRVPGRAPRLGTGRGEAVASATSARIPEAYYAALSLHPPARRAEQQEEGPPSDLAGTVCRLERSTPRGSAKAGGNSRSQWVPRPGRGRA